MDAPSPRPSLWTLPAHILSIDLDTYFKYHTYIIYNTNSNTYSKFKFILSIIIIVYMFQFVFLRSIFHLKSIKLIFRSYITQQHIRWNKIHLTIFRITVSIIIYHHHHHHHHHHHLHHHHHRHHHHHYHHHHRCRVPNLYQYSVLSRVLLLSSPSFLFTHIIYYVYLYTNSKITRYGRTGKHYTIKFVLEVYVPSKVKDFISLHRLALITFVCTYTAGK